ncbi:hypothetical protein GA0111570_101147 [Raineyella antarctica]|uniref:DUF218 domain-containing protein n=2 Tax=Raineyella antarctica TaxID=1577474 RepID=A0A1G6GFD4_9ACTN|nr:hypothetical protein GA0111570_101147 [Raineyella antarctica]
MVAGGVLLLASLSWLGLCIRFVAHPRVDPVEHVDAMYVIGPVETRWDQALARADEGVTPVFLATTSIDPSGHAYFPPNCGEQRQGYTIQCVIPDPYTTRGEARLLAEQVRAHGWKHVAVFTSTPHTARTRMLMERCVPATVSIWNYPEHRGPFSWLREFVYQSGAWVKAQFIRSC